MTAAAHRDGTSAPGSDTRASQETGPAGPAERYAASRARSARDRAVSQGELGTFRKVLDFELDPFQADACAALEAGHGVLVAAPTGAGKTVVGEFAVHLALAQGGKAFYTTPIKALSNQKYADLVARHGAESVGLLTGDTSINSGAPVVVMTTEVLRNMLYAGSNALDGLAFVVMDEVHYLADRFRGPVWEEVIIHLPDHVQLVSLSATVSNAEEFGDWLAMVRGDTTVVVSERRPVPLWQHVVVSAPEPRGMPRLMDLYAGHVDPTDPGTDPPINPDLQASFRSSARPDTRPGAARSGRHGGRGRGDRGYRGGGGQRPGGASLVPTRRTPPRFAVVDALDADALLPAIYFIFSRAGCDGAVQQCLRAGLRLTDAAEEAEIRRVTEERTATIPPEDLEVLGYWEWTQALARGVAAHHAGLLPVFRETVEHLFSRGLVKVVFATETLALGINMPARSVVLEKLVKWDGTAHQPVTPGEYTQLTGRAGRRGIDVEGHAVVVDHTGLDPVALAGLASKRLYPLRSSFRPTYNMAVNLVAQVGRERARDVLETSFAQFQADRGVVGLAKQAQAHAEALEGYAEAMRCDRGDFAGYMDLRRAIKDRENELARAASGVRRADAVASLEKLRRGDLVEVPGGRRRGYVVVLDPGLDQRGFDGPRPTVLTQERQVKKLTLADTPDGVQVVGRVKIPKSFNARRPDQRRDLASSMRNALGAFRDDAGSGRHPHAGPGRRGRSDASSDHELQRLRGALRAHPCHGCPDRDDHARWAERWERLRREHDQLVRRVEGRTGTIARTFDRTCEVLVHLGYLERADGPQGRTVQVTDDGHWLRRVYAEDDLLLAECLRRGTWDDLDAPGLAAAVSTVVYSGRREEAAEPFVPGGPTGRLAQALDATTTVWSQVTDLEAEHHLTVTGPLDLGLVAPVHRWASGRGLDAVLRGTDVAAGDFVRWCKQVIDVLDQLAAAAPRPQLRATARKAQAAVLRGVVAYSSL
ncbi:DEAD/DEAH box helicase [Isoptericola sp. NEAU-Y5]|uniref:DEAD/DEAH box helicase n=1 Tax=Isoptericola luteus TaxID=2879484 RepID=A0ABS7ZI86_9MICO|nr:DEAD/DEAH box helicase [Isoptericola sp. NEAU-Y5]MCA5894746.1 DEAD/DEAH box helicase [Isoptericola sp. NEAU-Y5]